MNEYGLMHYGIPRKSGRYPWGSGARPYQGDVDMAAQRQALKDQRRANRVAERGIRDERYRQKHTIPAGTKIYRTTVDPNEDLHEAMYVSYLNPDRYAYRGGWVRTIGKSDTAYENEYILKKDITVPGRDELSNVIQDVVKDNPEVLSRTVKTWCDMNWYGLVGALNYSPYYTERGKQFVNDLIAQIGSQPASKSYYMLAQTFGKNPELRGLVIDELKQRGYNAMTDEASVGGARVSLPGVRKNISFERHGIDALILFDGSDTLQKERTNRISRLSEMHYAGKQSRWKNRAAWAKGKWGVTDGVAL